MFANKDSKNNCQKSYLRKISDIAILGGMSAVLVSGLLGCDNKSESSNSMQQVGQKQGVTVTLQEEPDGSYKIVDEVPSSDGDTTIIVKDIDGNKRVLSKEEVDNLVAMEAKKIDNGTSTLTSSEGGGLGIGGAILASAAGALIGSYIGNKLFNNSNYRANAQRGYSSPSAYQRSQSNFNRSATSAGSTMNRGATSSPSSTARSTPSNAKSGFFSGGSSTTSSS